MIYLLVLLSVTVLASAEQLPQPTLPMGDINVVVVTDVHSWVGGHKDHEEQYSADYGDVLSFVERLKAYAAAKNQDVWFVMNGDWIDGTGLAMNGDPSKLIPILERMPFDAVNVGNHELYRAEVIEFATATGALVEWFGKKYLTSNVLHTATMEPIGHRYRILAGNNANVLTFGFLYDMKDSADIVTIKDVEKAVEEKWFVDAVKDTNSYDAVLVLAHMDVRDDLCQAILGKIRTIAGDDMPVQFITGHTHRRDYEVFDKASASFEGGRFLDTVGFVSFPRFKSGDGGEAAGAEIAASLNLTKPTVDSKFKYKFLDANVDVLADALGVPAESLPTENGIEQSEFIYRIQYEMGLKKVIGCAAETYYVEQELDARDSLWGLFRDQVVSSRFSKNQVVFLGNEAWRYDLFKGDVRLDDAIAVSPFNNTLWFWENVPAETITALNRTMNALPAKWESKVPNYVLAAAEPFQPSNMNYTLIVDEFEAEKIQSYLKDVSPNGTAVPAPVLLPDVTTTSIWLDYFQEQSHTCKQAKQQHKENVKKKPDIGSSGAAGFGSVDPEADTIRLAFVGVAVVLVVALGSIAVWQKSVRFDNMMEARQFATLEAMREYEGEEADNDDDYDDDSEGEFV